MRKYYKDVLRDIVHGEKNDLVTPIVRRSEISGELVITWGNPPKGSYGREY